jgi:hypothetical protein
MRINPLATQHPEPSSMHRAAIIAIVFISPFAQTITTTLISSYIPSPSLLFANHVLDHLYCPHQDIQSFAHQCLRGSLRQRWPRLPLRPGSFGRSECPYMTISNASCANSTLESNHRTQELPLQSPTTGFLLLIAAIPKSKRPCSHSPEVAVPKPARSYPPSPEHHGHVQVNDAYCQSRSNRICVGQNVITLAECSYTALF